MEIDKLVINKMPDRTTLEEFINGMNRRPTVIFNIEKGEFEWLKPREMKLGEPKTELGRRLREI